MNEIKPKRRWFRFSLRTLFVLLTLLCVLLGAGMFWYGSQLMEHRRQQEVAERIIKKGGRVYWISWVLEAAERSPWMPGWLLQATNRPAFHRIVGIDLRGAPDADGVEIAAEARKLPHLGGFTFPVIWLDDPRFLNQLEGMTNVDLITVCFPITPDPPKKMSLQELDELDRLELARAESRLTTEVRNRVPTAKVVADFAEK